MKTLIGSRAAIEHFPDFYRECKDWDYITDKDEESTREIEYHNTQNKEGLNYFLNNSSDIATPEFLYTLKVSHCFWNIKWQKTMQDILFFQDKKVVFNEELFNLLYVDWVNIHGKKRAYLKKSNEDFFKDNVNRVYVHDSIHVAMAYNTVPMYSILKKDPNSALLSEDLFNSLPVEKKFQLCREEAYVTALERILIPKKFLYSSMGAYRYAMCKLLTSMSQGFFPKFIALNWKELNKPDIDYISKFKENSHKLEKKLC
jgi:hypothetical protein